jgi:hypothetical protein
MEPLRKAAILPRFLPFLSPLIALALSGCLAQAALSTATSIATAPVRVGSRAVDLATTSQSEADENRGRRMRQNDKKIRKLQKKYNRQIDACNRGETAACSEASEISGEIDALRSER